MEGVDIPEVLHNQNRFAALDGYKSYAVSVDYTILDNDKFKTIFVTTAAATITVTLPTAADNLDRVIEIIKVDSGSGKIVVDGEGAETINGRITLFDNGGIGAQYQGVRIKSNGTGWNVLDWIQPSERQYIGGQTYNGVTLNVTGANFTLVRGVFIPYHTIDGAWRLRFNFTGTLSIAAALTIFTITGISYEATVLNYQTVSANENSVGIWSRGFVFVGVGMYIQSGAAVERIGLSGDIELASKPTWAD